MKTSWRTPSTLRLERGGLQQESSVPCLESAYRGLISLCTQYLPFTPPSQTLASLHPIPLIGCRPGLAVGIRTGRCDGTLLIQVTQETERAKVSGRMVSARVGGKFPTRY